MLSTTQTTKVLIFAFLMLCCCRNPPKVNTDTPKPEDPVVASSLDKSGPKTKGIHETWLLNCQSQLLYLESDEDTVPELDWNSAKKKEILKLALKNIYENAAEWALPFKKNDNGTELVNINIDSAAAPHKGNLLSDGEIETTVEWVKDGHKVKTPIRSWTGIRSGVKKKLTNPKDSVCITLFNLKSWGRVLDKDVVVLLENTNEGDGCLQYLDNEWKFLGWSSYGTEPVYTIIMWEDNNKWNSTIRGKKLFPLEKEEICQVLGEQWGVIPDTRRVPYRTN